MITVAGEALVDLIIQPDGTVDAVLGGAPYNTARAAARLGAPVAFLGTLSHDRFGGLLAEQLVSDGVLVAAPRTQLPTTLAAAEIDPGGAASYRFYIDGTSAPTLEPDDSVGQMTEVFFTGGLGLVLEPMATTLADMVLAAPAEVLVMIDINCRPHVIADREAYVARLQRVLSRADIVKVSDDDLDYLSPGVDTLDAARLLLETGPTAVLVTAGSLHTSIVTSEGISDVPVLPLDAPLVDTIGAGDTFGGGFLAWWSARELGREDITVDNLAGAVAAAHAAAAVVVTRRGAVPPFRHDMPADWD